MVDALEAVRRVLRARGVLVDLQPDPFYQPIVSVRVGGRRTLIGAIEREPDEEMVAAQVTRERAVADGRFALIAAGTHAFRTYHSSAASLERELASNSNWRAPRGLRSRLAQASRRPDAKAIELTKRFTFAVLRKTSR